MYPAGLGRRSEHVSDRGNRDDGRRRGGREAVGEGGVRETEPLRGSEGGQWSMG